MHISRDIVGDIAVASTDAKKSKTVELFQTLRNVMSNRHVVNILNKTMSPSICGVQIKIIATGY